MALWSDFIDEYRQTIMGVAVAVMSRTGLGTVRPELTATERAIACFGLVAVIEGELAQLPKAPRDNLRAALVVALQANGEQPERDWSLS